MRKGYLEHIIVLLIGAILIGGILFKTSTLSSGYHFLDDHELLRIEYSLEQGESSVSSVTAAWMRNDLSWRFRPFYWVERVVGTAIFGSDLLYWNYYKAIMGVLTFYLLYFAGRYLKQPWYISMLFVTIIMLGAQFTPWYRSANQESTGLLLCAFVLYMIGKQYREGKFRNVGYNIAICMGTILCGLIKESFTLIIPAFIALKYWLEYSGTAYGTQLGGWKQCFKNNFCSYLVMGISFAVNVCVIIFGVGVDKVSYAGFREDTDLSEYFAGIKYTMDVFLKNYLIVGIILILILLACCRMLNKEKRKYYIGLSVIGVYIIITQLVVHAKSMMWERYIIPFIIGYTLLFVIAGYQLLPQKKILKTVYLSVLAGLLLLEAPTAYIKARDYAGLGRITGEYLQAIHGVTNQDSIIIGAFADEELNLATSSWLEVNGRTKEYYYDWETGDIADNIQIVAYNGDSASMESADVTLCYKGEVEKVVALMGLADEEYSIMEYWNYAAVVRK